MIGRVALDGGITRLLQGMKSEVSHGGTRGVYNDEREEHSRQRELLSVKKDS